MPILTRRRPCSNRLPPLALLILLLLLLLPLVTGESIVLAPDACAEPTAAFTVGGGRGLSRAIESGVLDGGGTESKRQLRLKLAACCWPPPPFNFTTPPPPSNSPWDEAIEVTEPSSDRMELIESMDISLSQDSLMLMSSLMAGCCCCFS